MGSASFSVTGPTRETFLRAERGRAIDLQERGQLAEAAAHNCRGLALKEMGHLEDALSSFDCALALKPDFVEAHLNHGAALHDLKRFSEAIASYDRVIALRPDFASAHNNRALVLRETGRLEDALVNCGRAIALKPDYAEAFYNRGLILRDLGRLEAALASFDRASTLGLKDVDLYCDRGGVLRELRQFEAAVESYGLALALRPDCVRALNDRGLALHELERLDESFADLDRAVALRRDFWQAHNNRGGLLRDLGRVEEAVASYDKTLALNPDFVEALSNRGQCKLALAKFAEGWADYENRCRVHDYEIPRRAGITLDQLSLSPQRRDVQGKRVLVIAEQGVGDEIMFSSMLGDLAGDAQSVSLECDARLATLFARSVPFASIVPRKTPASWKAEDYDCLLPAGSMGTLYRNTLADFPQRERYLAVGESIVEKWRERLSSLGAGLKVGISWKGGIVLTHSSRRSIPLENWAPILGQKDVHFVSLQYGNAKADVDQASALFSRPITRFAAGEIDDFDQLAGLVSALDLVITVQTTLVHLSGAIGRQCWVMVPKAAEWRYGTGGRSMPWYRSVELYRQRTRGDWRDVIGRVAADLAARKQGESHEA